MAETQAETPTISNISLAERAYRIRRNALRMGAVQGQGYIAQALGISDVLAVAYFHALRYRPEDPEWEERDRFCLSIGHYAIALYSVLIEAGVIPEDELETYGTHDSRLPMSGMASYTPGMAREGFLPFATTYAVFASRRAYDFICLAIAEEKLNVKIVCALPGLTTGYGPSHQATDDLAIFRAMPNLTVIDPCDALEIEQAVPVIADHHGPVYMRLLRGNVPLVLDKYDYRFELGKAKLLRDGALIISAGFMTMRALEAAETLSSRGIDVAVLHSPTIKPLDEETILEHASRNGRLVVVAENHSVVGGLGQAVATLLLSAGVAPPFKQVGLPDAFLDAGALPTLHDRYGISAEAMVQSISGWL